MREGGRKEGREGGGERGEGGREGERGGREGREGGRERGEGGREGRGNTCAEKELDYMVVQNFEFLSSHRTVASGKCKILRKIHNEVHVYMYMCARHK